MKTKRFDPACYLTSDEALAEYINAALETGDPAFIADSLGIVARAKGIAKVARQAGLGCESLYKALCAEGNPEFSTVLKVVEALGLRLTAAVGRSSVARRRKRTACASVPDRYLGHTGHVRSSSRRRQVTKMHRN